MCQLIPRIGRHGNRVDLDDGHLLIVPQGAAQRESEGTILRAQVTSENGFCQAEPRKLINTPDQIPSTWATSSKTQLPPGITPAAPPASSTPCQPRLKPPYVCASAPSSLRDYSRLFGSGSPPTRHPPTGTFARSCRQVGVFDACHDAAHPPCLSISCWCQTNSPRALPSVNSQPVRLRDDLGRQAIPMGADQRRNSALSRELRRQLDGDPECCQLAGGRRANPQRA